MELTKPLRFSAFMLRSPVFPERRELFRSCWADTSVSSEGDAGLKMGRVFLPNVSRGIVEIQPKKVG
jgi:hypothetical protein